MRRSVSIPVCVLMTILCCGLNAQIPEGAQFQPGSYAVPYHRPMPVHPLPAAPLPEEETVADDSQTDWEKQFSPQHTVAAPLPVAPQPPPYEVPHLTYVYNHFTGRFRIAPYEPGYAADPSAFPVQTSPMHIWVYSPSSAAQPHPQVPYMSYYDPDPVIMPAEIRLPGSRFVVNFPQIQTMPLPVPRPDSTIPVRGPRLTDRVRQTFGSFIVP